MRNRKKQRQLKRQCVENRVGILERNIGAFETFIPKFNIYIGQSDPTPYEAIGNIVLVEKRAAIQRN